MIVRSIPIWFFLCISNIVHIVCFC